MEIYFSPWKTLVQNFSAHSHLHTGTNNTRTFIEFQSGWRRLGGGARDGDRVSLISTILRIWREFSDSTQSSIHQEKAFTPHTKWVIRFGTLGFISRVAREENTTTTATAVDWLCGFYSGGCCKIESTQQCWCFFLPIQRSFVRDVPSWWSWVIAIAWIEPLLESFRHTPSSGIESWISEPIPDDATGWMEPLIARHWATERRVYQLSRSWSPMFAHSQHNSLLIRLANFLIIIQRGAWVQNIHSPPLSSNSIFRTAESAHRDLQTWTFAKNFCMRMSKSGTGFITVVVGRSPFVKGAGFEWHDWNVNFDNSCLCWHDWCSLRGRQTLIGLLFGRDDLLWVWA